MLLTQQVKLCFQKTLAKQTSLRSNLTAKLLNLPQANLTQQKAPFVKDKECFLLVDEDGFGPSKLTQQIYSLPPLATRELVHMVRIAGLEPV